MAVSPFQSMFFLHTTTTFIPLPSQCYPKIPNICIATSPRQCISFRFPPICVLGINRKLYPERAGREGGREGLVSRKAGRRLWGWWRVRSTAGWRAGWERVEARWAGWWRAGVQVFLVILRGEIVEGLRAE